MKKKDDHQESQQDPQNQPLSNDSVTLKNNLTSFSSSRIDELGTFSENKNDIPTITELIVRPSQNNHSVPCIPPNKLNKSKRKREKGLRERKREIIDKRL